MKKTIKIIGGLFLGLMILGGLANQSKSPVTPSSAEVKSAESINSSKDSVTSGIILKNTIVPEFPTAIPTLEPTLIPTLLPRLIPTSIPTSQPVSSQVNSQIPPGSTARCRDGSYSQSAHRSGTCSHHGGVAEWY